MSLCVWMTNDEFRADEKEQSECREGSELRAVEGRSQREDSELRVAERERERERERREWVESLASLAIKKIYNYY